MAHGMATAMQHLENRQKWLMAGLRGYKAALPAARPGTVARLCSRSGPSPVSQGLALLSLPCLAYDVPLQPSPAGWRSCAAASRPTAAGRAAAAAAAPAATADWCESRPRSLRTAWAGQGRRAACGTWSALDEPEGGQQRRGEGAARLVAPVCPMAPAQHARRGRGAAAIVARAWAGGARPGDGNSGSGHLQQHDGRDGPAAAARCLGNS